MHILYQSVGLFLALPALAQTQQGSLVAENLGLNSWSPAVTADHRMVFPVEEYPTHHDLNGDGDFVDTVLHLFDGSTGTVRNLGFEGYDPVLHGNLLVVGTHEQSIGSDQTGDGDLSDELLLILNLATNEEWIFDSTGSGSVHDEFILFSSREASIGHDVNQDDDLYDIVPRALTRDGELLEFPWSGAGWYREGLIAITSHELHQGNVDVNGDGDTFDYILQLIDSSSGQTYVTNLPGNVWDVSDKAVLFLVSEASHGVDFNGDGDKWDSMPHLLNRSTGCIESLDIAVEAGVLRGSSMFLLVSESAQEEDWNGDGDTGDLVLVYYEDIGQAPMVLGAAGIELRISAERLVFHRREDGQVDLNQDGDMEDYSLASLEFATGTEINYGLDVTQVWGVDFDARGLLAYVSESKNSIDFNGDNDLSDAVAHLITFGDASVSNLGVGLSWAQTEGLALVGRWSTFLVREYSQGPQT